ncbi:hypothetical protein [Colwellia psychrerythraea]|uniref:Uncharacterized protein n=1 Tax=Colwellia psychrerythraea TaxID=28229 RepID=A0A099KG99_COLPS|nr:hypothetical protein [Colwellia psychrerythraea]KGJ89804.1 hypothetical protein GAB14E_3965 [Colwellia psychrerythraea]
MANQFDPKGKPFSKRLKAFLDDAKSTYNITVGQDSGRTIAWQQKYHVAHMFLYNSYKSTKPSKVATGKRTIAWSHFSDPKVIWATVKFGDFLKTAKNQSPIKEGQKWKSGFEPDQKATEKHVKSLQTKAGIGNAGKAMVSSGLKPCGQPCKCGAGRSKHLDGVAADLNSSHLVTLTSKLTAAKAGTLDAYLALYGLHRPLLNHPTSPEKWHIEAKP